jgi:hypothetical protein
MPRKSNLLPITALFCLHSGVSALQPMQEDPKENPIIYKDPCVEMKTPTTRSEYISCLKRYSNEGDISSALILVDIFNGLPGFVPDQVQASFYAAVAAERNDPNGLRSLAVRKAIGLGTQKNWEEALVLRRRQAAIEGELPPLQVSGVFTGQGFKDGGVVPVEVRVLSDSTKQYCSAKGSSDKLNNLTCKVIMQYFSFLPAVNSLGKETDGTFSTVVTFTPYKKPDKIDDTIPARLVGGEITVADFRSRNVSLSGKIEGALALKLTETGAILACNSNIADKRVERAACDIAKGKLKFSPAKNARGRGLASDYSLSLSLDFDDSGNLLPAAKEISPSPSTLAPQMLSSPAEQMSAEDKILNGAINRCIIIGFEKESDDYKRCVLEQIKILSKIIDG